MKIYIDLLIFQDTIFTSLILFLLNKLCNLKINFYRIFLVSFLSSIISVIFLIINPKLFDSLLIKIVVSFFIVKFTLNVKFKELIIPKMILLWIITVLVGGISLNNNNNLFSTLLMIGFTIAFILKYKKNLQKHNSLEATSCIVEFLYKGKLYKFKTLIDTGHDVSTIYDEEVIFVKDILFNYEGGDSKKERIVSYQTVSGNQKKIGIKIYNIKIIYGEKNIYNNAVIVSTPNILNNFDAIIGYHLIEGGWTNGNTVFNQAKGKETIP